ncbi:hypothetical protein N7519_009159 [Penicillium mononematosum]|uniref:uncharacterized protein n=1 Tax=Penicillium mononematosum TaxID=268346 RepID=UPI002547A64C|nr:uncharacterized protein N7519_009159 [Penicillium mononematosum]KAJ6178698.1 hypothetical protein N7519_009159 [Penicillium mononematosum]
MALLRLAYLESDDSDDPELIPESSPCQAPSQPAPSKPASRIDQPDGTPPNKVWILKHNNDHLQVPRLQIQNYKSEASSKRKMYRRNLAALGKP